MDEIDQARSRLVNGTGDAVDEWRLKAGKRREMVTKDARPLDTIFKTNDNALDEDVVRGIYQDTADALDRLGTALSKQIRALEREVSELKGELKGMRATKIWRPGE